jgi:hypothetical protein
MHELAVPVDELNKERLKRYAWEVGTGVPLEVSGGFFVSWIDDAIRASRYADDVARCADDVARSSRRAKRAVRIPRGGRGTGGGAGIEGGGGRKVYRGVPSNTKRGRDAMRGVVRPRGSSKDYLKHVKGEDVAADVTSWTRDKTVARRFGDVVLELDDTAVKHRIVPHPAPSLRPDEQEILIRGVLRNVKRAE